MKNRKDEVDIDKKYQDNTTKTKKSLTVLKEKFKELRTEAKEDCKAFDEDFAMTELAPLSSSKSKWLNYQQDFLVKLDTLETIRKNIKRDLYEFYKIDYSLKLDTKDELNLFIESDSNYQYQLSMCNIIKDIVNYCENTIKILEQKQWAVKTFLEYNKYYDGN